MFPPTSSLQTPESSVQLDIPNFFPLSSSLFSSKSPNLCNFSTGSLSISIRNPQFPQYLIRVSRSNSFSSISPMAIPPLKAVTLTHVRYTRGDQLGHFLAWVSLVPVFVSFAGFASHFMFRRDLQGIAFAFGLVFSQFVNELIKNSVQQARPETCVLLEMCDSHGWPSSHSQYMFFFATYFALLNLRKANRVSSANGEGVGRNLAMELVAWALAVLTMYSRVYLGYHTVSQVFAGAFLGMVIGASWFWLVYRKLIGYFPLIEESDFAKRFYIKDTSHIPNVMKFEYEHARAARKETVDKRS